MFPTTYFPARAFAGRYWAKVGATAVVAVGLQWTTNAEGVAPAAAAGVSVTPSATSWGNSAWVEVLTTAPTALVLTGLSLPVAGVAAPCEVDVGVGASGAEAVITTFRGDFASATTHGPGYLPHVVPLAAIPAAARVAVRLRKNGTSVVPWACAITYLQAPVVGTLQTTTQPQRVAPPAATLTVTAGSAAVWTNGAWSVLVASTATALVLTGVVLGTSTGGTEWEVDLGVGAPGSEAVITTLHGHRPGGLADGPNVVPLVNPLAVASGARLVARFRNNEAFARTCTVAVVYQQVPL